MHFFCFDTFSSDGNIEQDHLHRLELLMSNLQIESNQHPPPSFLEIVTTNNNP